MSCAVKVDMARAVVGGQTQGREEGSHFARQTARQSLPHTDALFRVAWGGNAQARRDKHGHHGQRQGAGEQWDTVGRGYAFARRVTVHRYESRMGWVTLLAYAGGHSLVWPCALVAHWKSYLGSVAARKASVS